jgi:hypothetical protein
MDRIHDTGHHVDKIQETRRQGQDTGDKEQTGYRRQSAGEKYTRDRKDRTLPRNAIDSRGSGSPHS